MNSKVSVKVAPEMVGKKRADALSAGTPSRAIGNPILGGQQTLGNQAMLRLLDSGTIQTKLRVSQPGDEDEKEADCVAEKIISAKHAPKIQRKCACGGSCAECQQEEADTIHRSVASPLRSSVLGIQRAPATDAPASDIPAKTEVPAKASPTASKGHSFIVDDDAKKIEPHQMRKSQFIALLRTTVCTTADTALAAAGRSSKSCPYIELWIAFYAAQNVEHIEGALHKYAPETRNANRAEQYFPMVSDRVRKAVIIWAKTGRITGIPPGVPLLPTATAAEAEGKPDKSMPFGSASGSGHDVLKKARDGGQTKSNDAEMVRERLGPGRPVDSNVRARMESVFGQNFSHVRFHTDGNASRLSNELDARAFTIGQDVAFASGEYQPGTLTGDALIAHELAHVVQQNAPSQSNAPMLKSDGDSSALEVDADVSAVGAIVSLWSGAKGKLSDIARNAPPRLKSGLKLQRCGSGDCPPGYCWQVFGADAGLATCTCHWRCSSVPTSGPVMSDPNAIRPSVPTDFRHNIGGLGSTTTIVSSGCLCPDLPNDRGAVCSNHSVVEPTSDVRDIGGALAGTAEARARTAEQSRATETRPTIVIEGAPSSREAKPSDISRGTGEKDPSARTGGLPAAKQAQAQQTEPTQKVAPPPPPVVEQKARETQSHTTPEAQKETAAQQTGTTPEIKQGGESKTERETQDPQAQEKTESAVGQPTAPLSEAAKQSRLADIRQERSANDATIRDLNDKIKAAADRAREAGEASTSARGDERTRLQDKARRNGETRDRLTEERNRVAARNAALNAEETRLTRPPGPTTWQEAEQSLRDQFGGQKKRLSTDVGDRDIDCYTPDGISREAKFGPQGLSQERIQLEIDKDIALLKSGKVKSVEWHFYKNRDGAAGPSGPLVTALTAANIKIVLH